MQAVQGLMATMDRLVVKPFADGQAIAECAQPAERRRVRQREQGV
jgi:hypothetical protein